MTKYLLRRVVSSSQRVDLAFLYFIFHFYFHAVLFFYFSIFRTTRVKGDRSHCHISHNGVVTRQITVIRRKCGQTLARVRVSRT